MDDGSLWITRLAAPELGSLPSMTDEPLIEARDETPGADPAGPANPEQESNAPAQKGSPEQPWQPEEQPYSDRPEQGGATPGGTTPEPPD